MKSLFLTIFSFINLNLQAQTLDQNQMKKFESYLLKGKESLNIEEQKNKMPNSTETESPNKDLLEDSVKGFIFSIALGSTNTNSIEARAPSNNSQNFESDFNSINQNPYRLQIGYRINENESLQLSWFRVHREYSFTPKADFNFSGESFLARELAVNFKSNFAHLFYEYKVFPLKRVLLGFQIGFSQLDASLRLRQINISADQDSKRTQPILGAKAAYEIKPFYYADVALNASPNLGSGEHFEAYTGFSYKILKLTASIGNRFIFSNFQKDNLNLKSSSNFVSLGLAWNL